MKLYIIIPHYILSEHVAELAKKCIESFKKTADCVVVSCDDCSPFNSSFLKDISDVYIRNEKNLGFGANCNVGFKWVFNHEKEDCWIVSANNDIEVFPYWFEDLKQALSLGDGSIVGGLGFKDRKMYGDDIKNYNTNVASRHNDGYITEGGRLADWMFPGGFYMTTKKAFEEIGIYDENFIHGGYEDIDLFLRFKKADKRLIMTPKVAYWHEEGATRFSETQKGIQDEVTPKNLEYFLKKWEFKPHQNILQFMIDNRINY